MSPERYPFIRAIDLSTEESTGFRSGLVTGPENDPDIPHPTTTTVGKCNKCRRVYKLTTGWEWRDSSKPRDILLGFWMETSRILELLVEEDWSTYKRFMTTLSCPDVNCKGQVDGGNFNE